MPTSSSTTARDLSKKKTRKQLESTSPSTSAPESTPTRRLTRRQQQSLSTLDSKSNVNPDPTTHPTSSTAATTTITSNLLPKQHLKLASPTYAGTLIAETASMPRSYSYTVPSRRIGWDVPATQPDASRQSSRGREGRGGGVGENVKNRIVKGRKFDASRTVQPFLDERARSALIELARDADAR